MHAENNAAPISNGAKQLLSHEPDAASRKTILELHEKFDRLMAKKQPSKREMMQKNIHNLYPKLAEYLAQGKPVKDVLEAFNALTHAKVCLRTFHGLLEEEAARRSAEGDPVCCPTCHQPIVLKASAPAGNTSTKVTETTPMREAAA